MFDQFFFAYLVQLDLLVSWHRLNCKVQLAYFFAAKVRALRRPIQKAILFIPNKTLSSALGPKTSIWLGVGVCHLHIWSFGVRECLLFSPFLIIIFIMFPQQ